jgi:hypothetical protein
MSNKLTPDILIKLGFNGEGRGITDRPLYRLEWQKNHYQLQVELGNYPETNPNSGIVSLYFPELRVDFVESEDEENVYGIKYVTFPAKQIPIAWYVTTIERLNAIYTALTGNEPLII